MNQFIFDAMRAFDSVARANGRGLVWLVDGELAMLVPLWFE